MPTSLPPIDPDLCERVCRTASLLRWRVSVHRGDSARVRFAFHSPSQRQPIGGRTAANPQVALTSACRALLPHLVP